MAEADVSVGMEAQTHLGEKGIVTRKTPSTYDDEGGIEDEGDFDIVVADTDDGAVREFTLGSFIKTATMDYGDSFESNMDPESFKDRVEHLLDYTLNSNDYLVAETELMNTSAEDLLDSPNEAIYEAADTVRTEMTQEFKEELEGDGWRARLDDNHPGRHNYSGWVLYIYEGDEYIVVNENPGEGVVLKTDETFSNQVAANIRFELGQISNTHGHRDIAHRYAKHTKDKSINRLNKVIRDNNKQRRKLGHPIKNEISKKGALYKYIEKIRPDLHEVTDDKGFTWYETKITDADGDAVMLFQTEDKIVDETGSRKGLQLKNKEDYTAKKKTLQSVINDPNSDSESLTEARNYLFKLEDKARELGYKEEPKYQTSDEATQPLERTRTAYSDEMVNDEIVIAGGIRSGNSKGDETRRKYIIYDYKSMLEKDDIDNAAKYELGSLQLFVEDRTGKIRGLVDIKIPKDKRKQGAARKAIEALVNSEFSNKPFKIYDIQRSAYQFWKKMGVTFVYTGEFNKEVSNIAKRSRRASSWMMIGGLLGTKEDIQKQLDSEGKKKQDYLNSLTE
jgi:hypothetical protein